MLHKRSLERRTLAAAALAAVVATCAHSAHAGSLRLAGVLLTSGTALVGTRDADAWCYPVGDPHGLSTLDSAGGEPPYRLLRTVSRDARGRLLHQGADLGNQRSGGAVRAAAAGLVVYVSHSAGTGYGEHIVLVHRLEDRSLIYTVYAHLVTGSTRVHEGESVAAGDTLGVVGCTGRATAPHLHFEIRRPEDPALRWELAPVLEPIAFLDEQRAKR